MNFIVVQLFILLIVSCSSPLGFAKEIKSMQMWDENRRRSIPVENYQRSIQKNLPVVIINHGYSVKNTEYSFIAHSLASLGYYVVSIQHDLDTDTPIPKTGNLFERRKPLWERGVKNISFVIDELKKNKSTLVFDQVILIGHSNGGDISMMFAELYPKMVARIISLDSLRYPFPRDKSIPILRFGASDTKPDIDVVPPNGVTVIDVKNAQHIDFCDRGSRSIKTEIQESIIKFLK